MYKIYSTSSPSSLNLANCSNCCRSNFKLVKAQGRGAWQVMWARRSGNLLVEFAVGSAGVQCRKSEVECQQERETRDVLESAVWSLISHLPPLVVPLFLSLSHTHFLSRSLSGCKSQLIIAGKANYRRHQLARPHGVSLKQGDSQQAVREREGRGEREGERETKLTRICV